VGACLQSAASVFVEAFSSALSRGRSSAHSDWRTPKPWSGSLRVAASGVIRTKSKGQEGLAGYTLNSLAFLVFKILMHLSLSAIYRYV